ncbi:trypsin-like peptidase domain-containing protein [Streptococcus cuniculi]|uniref:Serine protease n=1 Tax=Streptococcus cuniculi TaxID=1432788 RepID=A0A4Y9JCJ5_9STRE|nr:trypsin-like peptidase domain-containing protein [Streptococcus cuniculi]MBF0778530.1 trypsin-like peptidase domain-containing protein [Streptococcus cuniculi]TFU97624.1 trypsin-like serine protease [Streptococcus cuniculi]
MFHRNRVVSSLLLSVLLLSAIPIHAEETATSTTASEPSATVATADSSSLASDVSSSSTDTSLTEPSSSSASQTDSSSASSTSEVVDSSATEPSSSSSSEATTTIDASTMEDRAAREASDDPTMIFGKDDRVAVKNVKASPYRQVVALFIVHKGQIRWNGSGVLIAPNKVLTAAHVIRNPETNETYEKVIAVPANSGTTAPYGRIQGSTYYFFTNYINDYSAGYNFNKMSEDMAVVTLDSSFKSVGQLSVTKSVTVGQPVDVVGYPWDKNKHMYISSGKVEKIASKLIRYRNDTLPGNSGGPVLDKQNRIVAINVAEPKIEEPYTDAYWQEYGNNTGRVIDQDAVNLVNSALQNKVIGTGIRKSIPTYRLYHAGLRYHLYTNDKNEMGTLSSHGWRYEGVAWRTDAQGKPVYRLYHQGIKKHVYTTDTNEKNVLSKSGWKYEGIAWYSSGSRNVYRLYHSGLKVHLYTTDANEKDTLSKSGWKYEGIAWNVE